MDSNAFSASHIIAFVRPWDVEFFRELIEDLRSKYPGENSPCVRYLTFWKETEKRLLSRVGEHDEVIFLPDRLKRLRLSPEDINRLAEKERHFVAQGMTPLKTMMESERFAPRDGQAAEIFMWKMFAVLDELVPANSVLLSNQPDHVVYWIACDLCNVRHGRFFGFCMVGRPSGYTQCLRNASEPWIINEPGAEHFEMVDKQREDIASGVLPSFMAKRNPYPRFRDKYAVIRSRVDEIASGNYFMSWQNLAAPLFRRGRELRWKVAGSGVKHWSIDEIKRPFVYFPLHLEPEASTLVWAPYFKHQDVVIEWIAKSLPAGVDLVLKENPKMWGDREHRFYRNAARLPGVKWIEPKTASQDLVMRSQAVVTITGTVAIEAMALGKPVAVLGHPPYSYIIGSLPKIERPSEMGRRIGQLLDSKVDDGNFKIEFATFVANLIPKPFNTPREDETSPYPVHVYYEEHGVHVLKALGW
jgi:hypothetical protein